MKKFIFSFITMLMVALSSNAQIATENQKFFDNIYVGVEAGVATPLNFNSIFPLNTLVGAKVGKEITPVFGLEGEGIVSFNDNNFNRWTNTFVKSTNIGVNGTVNVSNLLFGYPGTPRVFEIKTNTGLGWLHLWHAGGVNDLTAKTALDLKFNLEKRKAHSLVITPGVYWNITANSAKVHFNKNFAQLGIMASYIYHFKTSNGTHHFKTYDVGAMCNEIDRLNEELAKKPNVIIQEVVREIEVPTELKEIVFFAYDSDELDENAKNALDALTSQGVYNVVGYASNEGTDEYNKDLSLRRANTVAKYLRDRGASVAWVDGEGVKFGPTTGRVVVVTTK